MTSIFEEIQIVIHGLWSRRWIAIGIAWAVALVGWLVVALIPNSYESKARVFVQTQSILEPKAGSGLGEGQQDLNQLRQTLTSVDNLVEVVKGTDLARTVQNDRDVGARVAMLKANITIASQQDNLFDITAKSSSPQLSQQIVGKLIDLLVAESYGGNRAANSQAIRILDGQINARTRDLQTAEKARVDFERRNIGMLPGIGSISQRIDGIRGELGQIDQQMVAAQSALTGINSQLTSTPATIDAPGVGGAAVNPLGQAMAELASARARGWTDSHPDVIAMKRQISALRAAGGGGAAAGVTRTPNPAYVQLRSLQTERASAVAALQSRRGELQRQIADMAAKQTEEPGIAAEQDRLERNYTAVKTQYDALVSDREEARLRGDVQSEAGAFSVRLIDPPSASSAPATPNRPLLLLGVLIAAIGAGVGIAFALGQLKSTYATASRLERATGLPVLGQIAEIVPSSGTATRRRQLRLFASASAGLVAACILLVVVEFVQRSMAA